MFADLETVSYLGGFFVEAQLRKGCSVTFLNTHSRGAIKAMFIGDINSRDFSINVE